MEWYFNAISENIRLHSNLPIQKFIMESPNQPLNANIEIVYRSTTERCVQHMESEHQLQSESLVTSQGVCKDIKSEFRIYPG